MWREPGERFLSSHRAWGPRTVAIARISPAVVALVNDGDKFTVAGSAAWDDLVKAAVTVALRGRAACVVETRHSGPLLVRWLESTYGARRAESKGLVAACLEPFSAQAVEAFVDAPEFEARWVWLVICNHPVEALDTGHALATVGDAIDVIELPTASEAIMSVSDGTELWWLNAAPDAESVLAAAASDLGWAVVARSR